MSTLERGGPISHMCGLVPHIASAGVEVEVLCQSEAVAALFDRLGIAVRIVPLRHKLDLPGAVRLWPSLSGPDVVHSEDRRAGLFARPLARIRGAGVIHTLHGLPEEIAPQVGRAPPPPSNVPVLRRAWLLHGYLRLESWLARTGMVVTPSQTMRRFLIRHGLPARRLEVIRSGIDVRRREPSTPQTPLRVGTVTNLEPWKGVDLLLEACAQLRTSVRVAVFGDGSARASLQRLATDLSVDATFHGHVTDARERLREIDLFVLPSRAENLPISLLEAMAEALPIVATRVGAVPEVVVHGESGTLVDPDNVPALVASIEELVAEPARMVALGKGAARRVAEHFDAAEAGRQTVRLYERLCGSCT